MTVSGLPRATVYLRKITEKYVLISGIGAPERVRAALHDPVYAQKCGTKCAITVRPKHRSDAASGNFSGAAAARWCTKCAA
jgi:hypothetical protein